MRRTFLIAASSMTASMALAASFRVDYNGELVSPWHTNGFVSTDPAHHPYGWDYYAEGAGGGLGVKYGAGGSTNAFALRNELEPLDPAAPYPGGHSVLIGGSSGAGRHGIKQTITSTAGKHYWMVGTAKGSTTANVYHQWGLSNGSSPNPGMETNGSVFGGSGNMGKQNYSHGLVATGNQITAMFGARSVNTGGSVNIYTDGIRVVESDVMVYNSLHNGSFDGATWNVSNWSNANPADSGSVTDMYMFDGWLPLGGQAGQVSRIQPAPDESGWGNALMVDIYKGGGRQFFFQRINDGLPAHEWDVGVRAKTANYGNADNRIGIDPTGGLNPYSPNVVWSNTNTANDIWETLWVTANGVGTNGITVFLATGWDFTRGNRIAGGTATGADQSSQTWFDSVPEPATMLLLALGSMVCLPRPQERSRARSLISAP